MLDQTTVVRELHLKRRRSRVPWVYAVYHRRRKQDAGIRNPESGLGQAGGIRPQTFMADGL
jgi:hypothetical protein